MNFNWNVRVDTFLEVDLRSDRRRESSSGGKFNQLLSEHFASLEPLLCDGPDDTDRLN